MMYKYTWRTLILEVMLIVVGIVALVPLVGLVNVSFKDQRNNSGALEFAGSYTFENYMVAWTKGLLGPALLNSAFVVVVGVVLIVVLGSIASYPLSRIGRSWSRWAFYGFLIGLVLPGQLGLLPLFIQMRDLGLVGTLWSVLLFAVGGGMSFTILILTTFLRELPREYEEAALIDGCGPIRTFGYVVFPLLRPAIGTVAILNALAIWNDFFVPLLFLSGSGQETIPIRILSFVGEYTANYPALFAALVVTSLPILLLFLLLQKSVIKGFSGGLKG